jgi:hypothetical protein
MSIRNMTVKTVETLLEKASKATTGMDALHFSQAACNAANAGCTLATLRELKTPEQRTPDPVES